MPAQLKRPGRALRLLKYRRNLFSVDDFFVSAAQVRWVARCRIRQNTMNYRVVIALE